MKLGVNGKKLEAIPFLMFPTVTNKKQNAQICHAESLLESLISEPGVAAFSIFWKS